MPTLLLAPALLIAAHLAVLAAALIAGAGAQAGRPGVGLVAAAVVVLAPVLAGFLRAPRVLVPAALAGWSLALLVLLPAMLPHAPASAINAGFSLACGTCEGIGELAYAVLPDLGGTAASPVAPVAAVSPTAAPPIAAPAPTTAPGDIVIPYQTAGNSIIVPITFQGRHTVELPMLFDTGATLTTLDQASLDDLGLTIAADAPIITTQTAAGPQESPVTLISAVAIGGHPVDNVTLSRCEPCRDDHARGLLGMNVSGRFLITIDTINQQLTLRPRSGGQTKDVEAWLELASSATAWEDGRIEVTLRARNRAPIPVSRAVMSVFCNIEAEGVLTDISPGQTAETTITLAAGADCANYRVKLKEAGW
jgi:hypothetical protein